LKREIELEARVENLGRIRDFLEDACGEAGVGHPDTHGLKVAVDEACSNVIEHGYAGRTPGPLAVSFQADAGRIAVTIGDRGRPFDPAGAPAADTASDWEKRPVGGLGWHLIRQLVDEIRYDSNPETGNRLTLVKKRAAGGTENAKGD
jgi:serine/threonine-protein kinase RsbW